MTDTTLNAFFDEIEKIGQGIGPGSLAGRMAAGAESPSAQASIQNLVGGGSLGAGPGGGGNTATPPPPAPPPPTPPAPSAGGGNPLGGAAKTPSASDLGIPGSSPF